MTIIIDTREQRPLRFADSIRKILNVGDYTTQLLEKSFAIERKSPVDLYGTILSGHRRFRKEINRAAELGITLVVFVESTRSAFINKRYIGAEYQEYPGAVLNKIITTIAKRYKIEFVWHPNRKAMSENMIIRLTKEEKKIKRLNLNTNV